MAESSPLLRPTPRRAFEFSASSVLAESAPSTPSQSRSPSFLGKPETPERRTTSRTRSILNLTASTLFGIYSPSGYESVREGPSTPWGTGTSTPLLHATGASTPLRQATIDEGRPLALPDTAFSRIKTSTLAAPPARFDIKNDLLPLTLRTGLLFSFGIAYGLIIARLHDNQKLAPINLENIDRSSWGYLITWGIAGVFLGGLLPWVDIFWEETLDTPDLAPLSPVSPVNADISTGPQFGAGADWNSVVRSVGAFIGIAFAIRKLPWQSSLQVSLTLALVNPFLWYLIDRSKAGFFLSSFVGITGTAVVLGLNPDVVPSPPVISPQVSVGNSSFGQAVQPRFINPESISVWTWIASVLFCSCVCFGNIGRRLGLRQTWREN